LTDKGRQWVKDQLASEVDQIDTEQMETPVLPSESPAPVFPSPSSHTISQEKLELNNNNLPVSPTGVKSSVKREGSTGASKKVIMLCC
jgi:hypothetical protein